MHVFTAMSWSLNQNRVRGVMVYCRIRLDHRRHTVLWWILIQKVGTVRVISIHFISRHLCCYCVYTCIRLNTSDLPQRFFTLGLVSWTDLSLESDSKVETLSQILEIFCWVCELRLNAFHEQAQLETWLSHRLKFEPMKEVSQIWVQVLMPKNTYIKQYNLFQNEIDKSWNLLFSFYFVITATYSIFTNNKSQ